MLKFQNNILFKDLTTLNIGGPIKLFAEANTKQELLEVMNYAKKQDLPFLVIGEGSNLLVSDEGYQGLVIKNSLSGINQTENSLIVKAGTNLQGLVDFTIENNLGGMSKMVGIPGTVGGAIYGKAGAYGHNISDFLEEVVAFDGNKKVVLKKAECQFGYRDSGFKRNEFTILEVKFKLPKDEKNRMKRESAEVLKKRLLKYKPGTKSPGSFFKNVEADKLSKKILKNVSQFVTEFGKIPAGVLIEQVGGKGDRLGQIKIAENHGNTFINLGGGKASDFHKLASKYFKKVKERFGIELEPEVQLINLPEFK